MATSGSVNFSVTGTQIIDAALRLIGVLGSGESASGSDFVAAKEALNMLIKQYMAPSNRLFRGFKSWYRERFSLTLTASSSFSLDQANQSIDTPEHILSVVLATSDDDRIVLEPMTVEEYHELPNQSETGDPTRYYYERTLSSGTLYLDYIPSDTTKTIEILYLRPLEDIDAGANTFDFPQHWYRPLKFALAMELGPEYGVNITEDIKAQFAEAVELANSFYQDDSKDFFQPGVYW